MTRHVEFTIDFDLTCWSEDMEDFEGETIESIRDSVINYIEDDAYELIENLVIKKVWYEED